MKCLKTEAAFLAGIGVFLVGTACLIAVEVHNIYPAREEQKFEEINCTLESCNMDASAKCSKHKHDNKEFSCLRVYVVCGSKAESNDSNMLLQTAHKRRLLTRNYHSLHKQVCSLMCMYLYVSSKYCYHRTCGTFLKRFKGCLFLAWKVLMNHFLFRSF